MKRILLVSFIGLILAGCGDKVTKEYLVGDWRCIDSEFKRFNSRTSDNFGGPVSVVEYEDSLKIINGKLYEMDKDGVKKIAKLNETEIDDNQKFGNYYIKRKEKREVISDDSFKRTLIVETKAIDNDTDIIDLRIKDETVCTRIK